VRVLVTLTRRLNERARVLLFEEPGAVLRVGAGLRHAGDEVELLLPAPAEPAGAPADARLFRPPRALRHVSHHYWEAFERRFYERATLDLALAEGGGGSAALLVGEEVLPVARVRVAGARMDHWRPGVRPEAPVEAGGERFSRYRGALGEGNALGRLQRVTAAVVGVGRLGSAIAADLARAGVALVLIDDDRFEVHSLEAMDADPALLGAPKVEAVAAHLRRIAPDVPVTPLAAPLADPGAFAACTAADLIASAPDDNGARLAAALAAAAYLRPHLDLGAGVFDAGERGWTAGADVRLILPGEGCLVCAGGLDLARRRERDWRRERAGSLRSLNQVAVGQGMALVERLVVGDLARSVWVRLVLERDGTLGSEVMRWRVRTDCPVCGATGRGDRLLGSGEE